MILSTLGTSNYLATKYVRGERVCDATFFPQALAAWFPDDAVKVLVTKQAKDKHWHALSSAIPHAVALDIPDGASEADAWEMFRVLAEAVPIGERVILDITHGFRSLPVVVLLATSFLRIAKDVKLEHLLYGAWEARDLSTNTTPVFDLTSFVTMLDWANATDRFMDTGDASAVKAIVKRSYQSPLNGVVDKMADLSEALSFARADRVMETAFDLNKKIDRARAEPWEARDAPLRLLMDRVATRFGPMACTPGRDRAEAVLDAQLHQIRWLAEHGHYPAAASLAREWMVSVRLVAQGLPLDPVDNKARDEAERWLNGSGSAHDRNTEPRDAEVPADTEPPALSDGWLSALRRWHSLGDLRNDLMHFGMRQSPRPPRTIRAEVNRLPDSLREAARCLGIAVGPETPQEGPPDDQSIDPDIHSRQQPVQ